MSLVTPTLVTERLRLRPLEDEDASFLWELMSAPFVLRYWDEPPWRDPSRAQRFVDQSRRIFCSSSNGLSCMFSVSKLTSKTKRMACSHPCRLPPSYARKARNTRLAASPKA